MERKTKGVYKMKKILALVLAFALVISSMPMVLVSADESTAVPVTVVADESWDEATYDPATGYLTDVTGGGYYFKVTLDSTNHTFILGSVSGYVVTASKVVIPYKITYNDIEYTIDKMGSYLLTGGKQNTTNNGITELVISEGITAIGNSSFRAITGLTTVKIPTTVKSIDANCFASSKSIAAFDLPEGLTTLGSGAFQFTAITSITLPSTITSFGGSMFYGCTKLSDVNILFPYTALPGTTFRSCSALKSYTFPEGVTSVGSFAFSGSGVTALVFPATITEIPKQVASVAKSLNTVTFEGEVASIGDDAFKNSSAIRTITFNGKNAPTISNTGAFSGCKQLTVNYPADGVGYDSAEWQAFFPTDTVFVRAQGEPMIEDLVLIGKNVVETPLTTTYTYIDPMDRPESGSIAVWEGCEEADFTSSEVFPLKTQECSSANPPSYMIQETDDGKYIRVTITPKNADATLNTGEAVWAQLEEKVRLPQTIPAVELTAPSNGYVVNCNSAVNLAATAVCDNTTITKVEFYANDVKVAEVVNAPYETTWTPTEMGDYTVFARAYNAIGEDQVSDSVTVTVLSEDASIDAYIDIVFTSPVADEYILTGTAVTFTATATETSGAEIIAVEIFANGKSIHTATTGDISFTHQFEAGKYTITATAKSADGKTGYSTAFDINISGMTFTKMTDDNMVLQRNRPMKITGYGVDGTVITAQLLDKTATATVTGGKWVLNFPAMPTTKSTTLTLNASDGTSRVFQNVAIGEVLLCSGQSNMTAAIGNQHTFASYNPQENIRIFKTGTGSSATPETDVLKGEWNVTTTALIKNFSSVGYLTGYNYFMSQNGEVPVGIIMSAVSGTGIALWVPDGAYNYDPDLKYRSKSDSSKTHYNSMIAPWTGYTIGQIVWYQGESDSTEGKDYEKMLTAYIQSYREEFEDNDLKFIIVQLPVYDSVVGYGSPYRRFWLVREAEWNVSEHMEGVETVVTIDTGSIGSVHPGGKDVVGQRAGLIMQHFASPSDGLIWKSPNYSHNEIVGDKMIIYFNDVGAGLTTKDGLAPKAFKVAGDDMIFTDATATLVGNTVEVDISGVVGTPSVRYACEDVPNRVVVDDKTTWQINLVNSAGLPMAPFRTDDAKIRARAYDETTGIYSDFYNFTPMIKGITACDISNGTAAVNVNVLSTDDDVKSVEVFVDGASAGQAVQSSEDKNIWTFGWNGATAGEHTFYAIATDELNLTSRVADAVFDSTTVTPRNYTYTLAVEKTDVTVAYDATNGAVANTTLDGVLVVAVYTGNTLAKVAIAPTGVKTASITAKDIPAGAEIKAFVFKDLNNIEPLTVPAITQAK